MLAPKFREIVVQILFALDLQGDDQVIDLIMGEAKISRTHAKKALAVAKIIQQNEKKFDARIKEASKGYELGRIPTVEKNILRYALFEIAEGEDPPLVIKEAIRLARKFSTPEAGAFIHALLQSLTSFCAPEGDLAC